MLADGDQVVVDPLREVARLAGGVEDEDRGALHGVVDHGAGDAAGEVEHLHAAAVGGDQRAFGGRQRDQELALGVLAVDHAAGPARPIGICATPTKFSMLPRVTAGSKE